MLSNWKSKSYLFHGLVSSVYFRLTDACCIDVQCYQFAES